MAGKAGQRWSGLRERAKTLEAERDRLDGVLGPVPEWEAEREAVAQAVEQATEALGQATQAEGQAARALAGLDAARREADALETALADLAARHDRIVQEDAALADRIEQADALTAQADQIEADHQRFEALQAQRADLDDKAGLFRGIDGQRHALTLEVERKKSEADAQLAAKVSELQTLDRQIKTDQEALAGRDQVQASLAAAQAAQRDLARLDAQRQERDRTAARTEGLAKIIAAARGELEGRLKHVIDDGRRLAKEVEAAQAIDLEALERQAAQGRAATERREALQTEGADRAAAVTTLDARLDALDTDRQRVEARRRKLETSDDDTCPTCGSDLGDDHRAEVLAGYDRDLAELAAAVTAAQAERRTAVERRDALRAEYVGLGDAITAGTQAAGQLEAARERLQRQAESAERLEALRAEVREVQRQIADEAFAPEAQAEKVTLEEALAESVYDEAAHQEARAQGRLRDHWASQARALDMAAERLAQTQADRARLAAALDERRAGLTRGDHLADLKARLQALDAQAASLGYDPAEHDRVGKALQALAGAPRRLSALLDAAPPAGRAGRAFAPGWPRTGWGSRPTGRRARRRSTRSRSSSPGAPPPRPPGPRRRPSAGRARIV